LAAPVLSDSLSVDPTAVLTYRNVSTLLLRSLDLFVATAYRFGIFEGESGVGVEEDALRLILLSNNIYFAGFKGSAYRSNLNVTDFSQAALAYLVNLEVLVEYNETNGVPGYQPLTDTTLSYYPLWGISWQITTSVTPISFPDGTAGNVYEITYSTPDGVFAYDIKYVGRPATVDGVNITENDFKAGFTINYYNYTGATGLPGAQIALIAVVGVEAEASSSFRASNDTTPVFGVDVWSSGYRGYLNVENQADSWDAQAKYARASVTAGYISNYPGFTTGGGGVVGWEAAAVILSYQTPNPITISHDPEVGADVPDTASTPPATTTSSVSSTSTGATSSATTGTSSTGAGASGANTVVVSFGMCCAAAIALLAFLL